MHTHDKSKSANSAVVSEDAVLEQRQSTDGGSNTEVAEQAEHARKGFTGAGDQLPHFETIQQSFGSHDVSGVRAFVGGEAKWAADSLGAEAYAHGANVGFASSPDLHTAAHEAAHVVQQQAGVQLKGGVGDPNDQYERGADAVADAVVSGRSAQGLLDQQVATGGGGANEAVQLMPRPAVVTVNIDRGRFRSNKTEAGLHKFNTDENTGDVTVRSGGKLGTGISEKIPKDEQLIVDPDHAGSDDEYVWVRRANGHAGFVKRAYLQIAHRVPNTPMSTLIRGPVFDIYDGAEGRMIVEGSPGSAFIQDIHRIITHLHSTNVPIAKKDKLLGDVCHMLELGTAPTPDLWGEATANIDNKIAPRVQADKAEMVQRGLITNNHQLRSVEFPGADFHKHGQAPVFLKFTTNNQDNPDPRKVVYKPGDLSVDARLFGKRNSLAKALDDDGDQISQYEILAKTDNVRNEKYGFMEFVDSGLPTNTADMMGVYRSLAANMALSYIVGLEDVHDENVLLLRDRVQVIDMEATTGRFGKKQNHLGQLDPTEGGFKAMLWTKAIEEGLRPKLVDATPNVLQSLPATGAATAAMKQTFRAVLNTARHNNFDTDFGNIRDDLAGQRSRLVPIPTAEFYNLIALTQTRNMGQWHTHVDSEGMAETIRSLSTLTGNTEAFLKRVLKSPGTYNALRRMEIPYYSRDLSNRNIYDEEDNAINPAGCSKVGQAINTEMNARRQEIQGGNIRTKEVYAMFNAQIITAITALNNDLRARLPNGD